MKNNLCDAYNAIEGCLFRFICCLPFVMYRLYSVIIVFSGKVIELQDVLHVGTNKYIPRLDETF